MHVDAHILGVGHVSQVHRERSAQALARAHIHFRACLRRAAWRGWVAYVEELLRGLEAANMSARYRALDAVMTWQYSLAFNRRLRELPVQETYALGVNGWLRRVPPAKMPAKLLEREALRIQATAMSAWRQVLADEEVIRVVRDKWQHMRLARGFGALRRRRHESRAAWARLEHIATEVLLGPRVRAWAEDVREARAALRRRREDVVLRQCVRNVWALVERRRRVVSFTQRWILNKQGGQGATLDRITAIFATWTEEVRSRAAVRSKRREQHRCLLAYACTTWRHKGSVLWDKWCHEGEQKEDGGAGTAVDECGGGVAFGSTSCIPGPEESVEEPWTSPGVLGGGERVSFLLASGGEEGTSEGVDVAEGGNAKVVGGGAVMEKILMLLEEKNMREYEEESLGHQHQAGMAGVEEEERKREGGEQASEAGIIAGISGGVELEGRSTGEGCESGLAGEEDGCVVGALVMLKGLMAGSQLPLALKQAASEWQELMDERIKMTQLSARDTHRGDEQSSAGACEVGPGDSSTCAATPHRVQVAGGDAGEDASPASPSASTGMGAGAGAEAGGSRGSLTSAGIALDEPDAVKDVTDTDTDRVRPSGVSPAQPILRSDVRLEEAHAGPCREGGVAEAPADVQAVFEDVKDEILSCLLPATVFLAHARLPGASSPSDTVQARALPDQGVVCAGETAACEDGDEAEVTTARMDVKGLVRLLKMCDVVPEHVSEEHATNLFVDLTSSLSTSLLASPYSGLMNAPFTGASARDAAAAAVLPLDSCGKAPGPSCSPAAASRASEEHGQEWGDEGGRSLKFGWGGGESITARGGYLNVKGLGWEHRAYRATIDYGAYCILVERVARLVAHDIKTRSVQGGGCVRGDAVCGGLDQGQENEAAIKKGERIKTKSKKWWAQRGAVESEPATLYERQLRRQAMSAEEARIAGVRSCVRGWGAREDVVGKGRREASLVRIGLRCAVQEDGEVSGGGRGQGWGGGVAACAGLGVRVAASRSVRSVLPKSVNHPVAHPHSMARGGGGGSGGSGAGCDVLRGPDCIVPKRMQLAYEHPAVSVLHVASGAGVGADGRVSANDGIGPRVLGGPFVQGVAVFRPGKRAGVLASGYGARCVMIADCKGQEEGGVTEGRREEGAGGGYVKLSGWLKRPLPVSGYVHAKEGKKVVLHRQGDRAQEAVGKVTWQDIGEVSEGSGIAGAAGTSKTPRRVHAVHVQRREYEEGSCMARLQARLRVLFESPVQAFVFFEQATTGTDLLRIANITVGLQALGLHDTKLQDLMASLDPTEAGAIGLRGFLAAVAWKPMRWPSLKGLLAELYYWRLNRGFVTAGHPQTIKTRCFLGRSSIEETKRHSRDEETERRLL